MTDFSHIDAGKRQRTLARMAELYRPRKRMTPDEWGAANRVYPPHTGVPGPRDPYLTPYAVPWTRATARGDKKRNVFVCGAQMGKALALDTPLPTPSGWTTMEEVVVGDMLFDENGKQCRVEIVSDVMEGHGCYRVVFSDGTSIVADAGHLWTVHKTGRLSHMPVTLTTEQLAEKMVGRTRSVWSIPVAGALETVEVELPVQPYVLGYWLGDGSSSSSYICCGDQDIDALKEQLNLEGCLFTARRERTAWAVGVDKQTIHNNWENQNTVLEREKSLTARLRRLGVINNKHVPDLYLRASREQRLSLLQGLMDSDGTIDRNGHCDFGVCNPALAYSVLELVRSLGLKPTFSSSPTKLNGAVVGVGYRIRFLAYAELPVFRLERKRNRQRSITTIGARPEQTGRRYIVSIDEVPSVPVKCLGINTPSHLYLAGEGMVPTHNTDGMLDVIGERMDTKPAPMIYVGPSKEFCTDQFEPRLMQLFDESKRLGAKVARGKAMKKIKKLVSGVPIRLAHAGSSTALKSDPAALALVDEYDGMVQNIKGQGDPLGLVEARGFTYADFVTAISSTPTLGAVECDEPDPASGLIFWRLAAPEDVKSPIWRLWQEGTRHHWAWPCPHCEQYFIPRMNCLRWDEPKSTKEQMLPSDARRTARLECPRCRGAITDDDKPALNAAGRMVAPGQTVDSAGDVHGDPPDCATLSFWVSGLCSPFRTFGDRAEDLVNAQRGGDASAIQTVINSRFGECYVNLAGDAPEWAEVKTHQGIYERGTVPGDVIYLVMTADVQKNRIIWVVRGWGVRGTSWLIDHGELWGETMHAGVWEDFAELIRTPIDGMDLKLVLIDSGFRPGKKDDMPLNRVYDFCRVFPSLVRPTKGSSQPMRVPLIKSKLEVNRKGAGARYGLELIRLDTDRWKSFVHEKVKWPDESPGAWHLFDGVSDDYCRQIVSESRVVLDSGRVEWVRRNKENHFLDCEAMQGAASFLLNVQRLRETQAPPRREAQPAPTTETQLVTVATQSEASGAGRRRFPDIASLLPK